MTDHPCAGSRTEVVLSSKDGAARSGAAMKPPTRQYQVGWRCRVLWREDEMSKCRAVKKATTLTRKDDPQVIRLLRMFTHSVLKKTEISKPYDATQISD